MINPHYISKLETVSFYVNDFDNDATAFVMMLLYCCNNPNTLKSLHISLLGIDDEVCDLFAQWLRSHGQNLTEVTLYLDPDNDLNQNRILQAIMETCRSLQLLGLYDLDSLDIQTIRQLQFELFKDTLNYVN